MPGITECFAYFILLFRNEKNKLLMHSAMWLNLKFVLSNRSQTKPSTCCMIPLCEILGNANYPIVRETHHGCPGIGVGWVAAG